MKNVYRKIIKIPGKDAEKRCLLIPGQVIFKKMLKYRELYQQENFYKLKLLLI